MRQFLTHEGWQFKPSSLPSGWMVRYKLQKKDKGYKYEFLSRDCQLFESIRQAVDYLRISVEYSEDDVKRIEDMTDYEMKQLRGAKYDWISDDSVPSGWKYRYLCGSLN